MLDGINALLDVIGFWWTALFEAPLYGPLTWGYFLISVTIMDIVITFFIAKLK